jgi:hypothetical protein
MVYMLSYQMYKCEHGLSAAERRTADVRAGEGAAAAEYPLSAFASPSLALGAVGTDAIFVPTFAYEFNGENAPENFLPPYRCRGCPGRARPVARGMHGRGTRAPAADRADARRSSTRGALR